MPQFHIRLAGSDLSFAAAHFLVWQAGRRERLHGHSYRVAAEVFGPLDENQCVVDFLAARNALKDILGVLDHRVLLPAEHPAIRLTASAGEMEVAFAAGRWVFPEGDCLRLPILNTTTESLAQYVGERLLCALSRDGFDGTIRVEIAEGTGCSAVCELPCVPRAGH